MLVLGALSGDWSAAVAQELAAAVDDRDDVTVAAIHETTLEVISAERPKRDAALQLANDIVAAGIGGALGTGIATAVAQLAGHLPG